MESAVDGAVVASGGVMTAADVILAATSKNTNETPGSHEISEQFSALSVGSKFMCGEAALEKLITDIMSPYGIKVLVKPTGAHKNKDESTKELFPHRRFYYACGSCDMKTRHMNDTEEGCCGFKIRLLLQYKKDDGEETHLEVREFKLPETSNHRLLSTNVRQVAQSNTIMHEKQLTTTKINSLHNSIQQFFTMHGLPWSKSTQKYLEEMGADSVEILKLMEQSEWESIFANEKPLIRRLAVKVFEDLRKEKVQTMKCATTIPFNKNPNNNVNPSSGQKRKHHTNEINIK
jgi:hypothetical protein